MVLSPFHFALSFILLFVGILGPLHYPKGQEGAWLPSELQMRSLQGQSLLFMRGGWGAVP